MPPRCEFCLSTEKPLIEHKNVLDFGTYTFCKDCDQIANIYADSQSKKAYDKGWHDSIRKFAKDLTKSLKNHSIKEPK